MDDKALKLISSSKQTKNWRKKQDWYYNGKHNECELYQFQLFYKITGLDRKENYDRLNSTTFERSK